MSLFEPIFAALETGATVLHGYARLTADVDIVVDQKPDEALKAIRALTALGFVARAPVNAEDYADENVRRMWFDDKGMRVLSLWDPHNPMREVDLFVENPIDFDLLYERSQIVVLATSKVRIASIEDLIQLRTNDSRTDPRINATSKRFKRSAGASAMADEKTMEWGSWAENDEQKLTLGLRATPAQRLAWLEEMIVLAYRSGALPRKR
jgi:hypothetical protein